MKELLLAHLASLKLGEATTHQGLGVFPLLAPDGPPPDYVLLDAALADGLVSISEVSEGGHVPELRLENRSPLALLLIEGEELVGAKQNRVLNTSLLIAPKASVTIPVSCVEAGRWRSTGAHFGSSGAMFHSSGRARKVSDVSTSVRERGEYRSDQGAVWDAVASAAHRLNVASPTQAFSDVVRERHDDLGAFRAAFQAAPGQAGLLVVLGGRVLGLDLFAAPATLTALLPKLATSYALDAVEAEAPSLAPEKNAEVARGFLDAVGAAPLTAHPSVSLGQSLRLASPHVAGAALLYGERVLHLCAFPGVGAAEHGLSPMARASRRRDALR
jgi:hypothetical protein